jgi:hypothetical protein
MAWAPGPEARARSGQAVAPAGSYVPVRLAARFGPDPRATPEEVDAAVVTPAFFPPRLDPIVGRFLTPFDGADDAFQPVVISYGLYYSRFGGDMTAIGTPTLVGGQRLSIIGVAPQGFGPADGGWLWLPRYRPAGDAASAAAAEAIDGEWDATFQREGAPMWPVGERERPLSGMVRGRVTLASVRSATCPGCLALLGTIRVPFQDLLPTGPPATLRLLPERPPGDTSRALAGQVLPGNRLLLLTTSGNCQRCGEAAIEAALIGETASGSWTLETAAVARSGDRGTVELRRTRGLGTPASPLTHGAVVR